MEALYNFTPPEDQIFKLGKIKIAKEVCDFFVNDELKIEELLSRHVACDWGDLPVRYQQILSNYNKRLISVFSCQGRIVLIETAWDCSQTKVNFIKWLK